MSAKKEEESRLPAWPEDWQATEETLRPELIAEHGEALLNRALNTERLIAFVGSGVSAAYGRVSWAELILFHARKLGAALKGADDPGRSELLRRLKLFRREGRRLSGDQIMSGLMLCEQIWHLTRPTDPGLGLKHLAKKFALQNRLADLKRDGSPATEWGKDLFRTWIKRETHDEWTHVARVLTGAHRRFPDGRPAPRHSDLGRLLRKLNDPRRKLRRSNVEKFARPYRFLFSRTPAVSTAKRWLRALADPALAASLQRANPCAALREHCLEQAREVLRSLDAHTPPGEPVSPVRYFAFGYVLDLLRLGAGPEAAEALVSALKKEHVPPRRSTATREALIPRAADPLHEIAYGLGVRRYATTNYDLEIERFFHDTAFTPPAAMAGVPLEDGAAAIRVGPLGGQTRDFVLSEHTVTDMLDFATGDSAYVLEVVHLHGRATDEEHVVVTERDYQHTYVREGGFKQAFDEAREAAFGGNPILFVGFGMSESDVLRPLRQFVTGPFRRNRAVIALLPAEWGADADASFAVQHYVRYGVSVIRYGERWLSPLFHAMDALAERIRSGTAIDEASVAALSDEFRSARAGSRDQCNIVFELDFLSHLLRLCFLLQQQGPLPDFVRKSAAEIMERVKVAVLTMALSAKLAEIRKGRENWWRTWQDSPRDRAESTGYTALRAPDGRKGPIWSRHRVNDGAPQPPALWNPQALVNDDPLHRRVLVITAPKGTGKGSLYSCLTRTWEASDEAKVDYLGQFFTTFGFTCEVASVWDALAMFLLSPDRYLVLGDERQPLEQDTKNWLESDDVWRTTLARRGIDREGFKALSRRERLDRALHEAGARLAAENRGGATRRLLIAFNVIDVLFDSDGEVRQGEIKEIFDILLSPDHDLPIDLFFVVREPHLPQRFRREPLRLLLPKKKPSAAQMESIRAVLQRCGVTLAGTTTKLRTNRWVAEAGEPSASAHHDNVFIYVLPPPDPADIYPESLWKKIEAPLSRALERVRGSRQREPAELFFQRQLVSNRFACSLVIQIIDDILHGEDDRDRERRLDALLGAIDVLPRSSGPGMSDRFFEVVLDYWFERRSRRTHEDCVLHELLIRHIAVLAMPVRAAVLDSCPRIRERLDQLLTRKAASNERRRIELIWQALESLVKRNLVLRIDGPTVDLPRAPGREPPADPNERELASRYQVHRSIQIHIYRRLGSRSSDRAEAHVFGPSLYAAQIRKFPQLHPTAYAFLCELVDRLSSYPEPYGRSREVVASYEERKRRADCLRAALGVTRTLFSLGVVTRFAEIEGLPPRGPSQMGYLEHHRLLIRWMIRMANWLDSSPTYVRPPFYRDETVWLFNECGVLSYAQGRCDDARALFDRALELQRQIEGPTGGPMRRRILLNAGLNHVDRGRLTLARRAFQEVQAGPDDDDPLHRPLATGFLGIVEHLSGELQNAREHYDQAMAQLTAQRRIRPVALLKQHSGYLLLHAQRYEDARREFRDALQLAETGGYADLAHYARLGESKATVRDPASKRSFDSALRRIAAAQEYAARMDIPRLTIEVLLFHGEILSEQGEALLAGSHTTRALQIANLNGLMFRRIFALEQLSRIYEARKDSAAASRLRAQALRAARSMEYRLAVFRINREAL